jgi:hypothetical protein
MIEPLIIISIFCCGVFVGMYITSQIDKNL